MKLKVLFHKMQLFLEKENLMKRVHVSMEYTTNRIILEPLYEETSEYLTEVDSKSSFAQTNIQIADEMMAIDINEGASLERPLHEFSQPGYAPRAPVYGSGQATLEEVDGDSAMAKQFPCDKENAAAFRPVIPVGCPFPARPVSEKSPSQSRASPVAQVYPSKLDSSRNSYKVFDLGEQFFGDDPHSPAVAHHDDDERRDPTVDYDDLLEEARPSARRRNAPSSISKKIVGKMKDKRMNGGDKIMTSTATPVPKTYTCKICKFSTKVLKELKTHYSSHSDENLFMCTTCSYTCKQSCRFKKHLLTHTEVKPYKCSHCPYSCRESGRLKIHMSTHTGLKPFKCSTCSYSCATRGDLKKHILTHTGEKPYKCLTCPYSCRESGRLKKHVLTHTGEKPFKCQSCNYCCTTCGDLKKHILTHTGEKPFKCNYCPYSCRESGRLKKHMTIHNGENQLQNQLQLAL